MTPARSGSAAAPTRSRSDDARDVAWELLVGTGAGAILGLVIGGVGGRLVMLVLRLESSASVLGLNTDDGFEIGRFTTATIFLLTVAAGLGGALGAAYVLVRPALPARGRIVIWSVSLTLYGGADLLAPGSFDFTALDPKLFAVGGFVMLPLLYGIAVVPLVERLLTVAPWSNRGLTGVLVLGSLPLLPVFPLGAATFGAALLVRRNPRFGGIVTRVARIAVPIVLAAAAVKSGSELWHDAARIL